MSTQQKEIMEDEFSIESLRALTGVTRTPMWSHALINTYFANWPQLETQELYKSKGKQCMSYWYQELKRIFNARLVYTEQFKSLPYMEYYTVTYPGESVRISDMSREDRQHILQAFTTQLGMHWDIFPYSVSDFEGKVTMPY